MEQKEKSESPIAEDPRAVNYEFHDDSDSNANLHKMKTKGENVVGSEKVPPCKTSVNEIEDRCKTINPEKEQLAQNPLNIECHVKLRRDPSIENFYKAKSDNDSQDSNDLEFTESGSKANDASVKVKSECTKQTDSAEGKAICRQYSSDESLAKPADMVYNVDIQVRKSGRLRSAKCASRYRGDYGIRVDIYKQLMNKTVNDSSNDDSTRSNGEIEMNEIAEVAEDMEIDVEAVSDKSNEKEVRSERDEIFTSEKLRSERLLDSLKASHSETEHTECKEDEVVVYDDKLDISIETDITESASEEFTVLKKPDDDRTGVESSDRNEACMETEHLMGKCLKVNSAKDSETKSQKDLVIESKQVTDLNLLNYDKVDRNMVNVVEMQLQKNDKGEVETEKSEIAESQKLLPDSCECKQDACNEIADNCACETGNEIFRSNGECDSKVIETECFNVTHEVPCSNVIEGNVSFACDIIQDNNTSHCVRNSSDNEVKPGSVDIVSASPESKTDTKTKKCIDSQMTKENINDTLKLMQSRANDIDKEYTGYVHSVGKSVKKMEKRIKTKKPVSNLSSGNTENELVSENSPVKDPAKVLESLRQKLFESAGADLVEADKVPKQFESKLISSKQRQGVDNKSAVILDLQDNDRQVKDSDSASGRSGKSTPRCSTPRQEASKEILEEVAKTLNVLHQAKRKSENSGKGLPSKRQRFEEKTFLLRSMMKITDDKDKVHSSKIEDIEMESENPKIAGLIAERTRSSRSSAESNVSKSDVCKNIRKSNVENSDDKVVKKDNDQEKTIPKTKPVKCSACSHIFKTKELLRKHFPCRIRQTRTWSQNKLRPNRAVKRIENCSKKFVCRLPKTGKPEPSKPRPQLLTYRKTKFRRVKGKRRRKLYQLLQELQQKRMPVKWRHLSIVYEDLSFKEQCLYKLGLICVGHASEGLERYTAEEITVFEQHRAKEKWLMEDAQNFEHSIPDTVELLTDLNVSTELSTDNQESDFFSPKHVITFPQENIQNKNCDIDNTTEVEIDQGAISEVQIYEKNSKEVVDLSPFSSGTASSIKGNVHPCYSFLPGIDEKEADASYGEVVDLAELPEKLNADISIQEYLEYFRRSKNKKDIDKTFSSDILTHDEACPRSQNTAQFETFTAIEEGTRCFEETKELTEDGNLMISVQSYLVVDPLQRVNVSEVDVKTTGLKNANGTNMDEASDIPVNEESPVIDQIELIHENDSQRNETCSESENFHYKEAVNDKSWFTCTLSNKEIETDDKMKNRNLEIKTLEEVPCLQFSTDSTMSPILQEAVTSVAENYIGKPVPELEKQRTCKGTNRDDIAERASYDAVTPVKVKKLSPRKKYFVVPDIELYHQTATIDDKLLADTPLAVQHERTPDKETYGIPPSSKINFGLSQDVKDIKTDKSTSKPESDFNPDLISQASGLLKDILGDVEKTFIEKDSSLLEREKSATSDFVNVIDSVENNAVIFKVTNSNTNSSPVKGILKNTHPKKEHFGLLPVKSSTGISTGQINEKSPGKKKIDFKTYAKRKGMIKENDEINKEGINSETSHEIEDKSRKEIGKETDEDDKEYMRLEQRPELEDGLLDRLLDAVNVIDSIIEEHKDQFGPEENDHSFSAITPEMAFEAAISNMGVDNTDLESVSKPYDIESVFPYAEVEKVTYFEKEHCSEFRNPSESNENDIKFNELMDLDVSSDRNVLADRENICEKSSVSVCQAIASDFNKSDEIILTGNDEGQEVVEDDIDIGKGSHLLTREIAHANLEKQKQETATESRSEETGFKKCELKKGNIDEIVRLESFEENNKGECKLDLSVNLPHQRLIENKSSDCQLSPGIIHINLNSSAGETEFIESVESEVGKNNNDFSKQGTPYLAEQHMLENICIGKAAEVNNDEIMRSPEHVPKKKRRQPDVATAIKESKRDFTIKYEMNGIVIKENLLTGDKNVVENSSPFRSSAESDSNFDQSSLSELDVSPVCESDTGFDSKADVGEAETVEYFRSATEETKEQLSLYNTIENKSEEKVHIEDCYIQSSEETFTAEEKGEETSKDTDHTLEVGRPSLSLEAIQKLDIENPNEIITKNVEEEIDMQETETVAHLGEENIDTCPEKECPDICDDNEEEMSAENVPCLEMEPLLNADLQLLRKVSDDNSVGSPPVLEKVEVSDNSMDELDIDHTIQETALTAEGGPPQLEPEHIEEGEDEVEQNKHQEAHPNRQERHFLDILGIVSNEAHDSAVSPGFESKTENHDEKGSKRSVKPLLEEFYSEESTLDDSIGRHFSDVVSEPVEAPKTPKSKLQILFDKSERGEVTLTQIKDILSPFSDTGKKKSIPKDSLLKIKSGIAHLLSNVKRPVRKDPSWLKRDALSSYSRQKNIKKKLRYKEEELEDIASSSDESIIDEEENYNFSGDSSESAGQKSVEDNFDISNKNYSKGSIADAIMQMLDSLEDKGSVAGNMSNLLDILAENLGFLSKGKGSDLAEDPSSDSDYSYSEEADLSNNSSKENTQKELIADFLEEGEQPPSLDDIPTASNIETSWKETVTEAIDSGKKRFNKAEGGVVELDQKIVGKDTEAGKDSFIEKSSQTQNYLSEEDDKVVLQTKSYSPEETLSKKIEESSEENRSVISENTNDDKCKATIIFKSITELNSIETDEESNTDESFDPVSMSARLSELKVLSKDNNKWEFNSDYNSDQEQWDNFDSEFENDFESQTGNAVTEGKANALSSLDNDTSERTIKTPDIADWQHQGSHELDIKGAGVKLLKDDHVKTDVLVPEELFPKDSSSTVFIEFDEKANYTEETENVHLFASKEYTESSPSPVRCRKETEISQSSTTDIDSEHVHEVKLLSFMDKPTIRNIPDKSLLPSSESTDGNSGSKNLFAYFVKNIEETEMSKAKSETQVVTDHLDESPSQTLKALEIPDTKYEDFSESEKFENIRQAGAEECNNKKPAEAAEGPVIDGTDSLRVFGKAEATSLDNISKNSDQIVDLNLMFKANDLHEEQYKPKTTQQNDSTIKVVQPDQISENDDDTNETLTYDEHVKTKTDFSGTVNNSGDTDKYIDTADESKQVRDWLTCSSLLEIPNKQDVGVMNIADKKEMEFITLRNERNENNLSLTQWNETEGDRCTSQLRGTDMFSSSQTDTTEVPCEEPLTKRRSTSFNMDDDDFSGKYCESIAEKVKRKQRERSKSVCYSFNPWLYYSAAYVREVTKPAKKEISVFRSSILEKRAREKSFSPEKDDVDCSSRKKRNSSVPKESKIGSVDENLCNNEMSSPPEPKPMFQIKPCVVALPKLTEDIINKYTGNNRKRQSVEDASHENRPPIKVTIKLSQIVYPPNSPYGSTSTSSDNYRSGYESCSEESEMDMNEPVEELETESQKLTASNPYESVAANEAIESNVRSRNTEDSSRQPLKIKMRTLLTKMNSFEESLDAPKSVQDPVKEFSGSFNESSNETNVEVSTGELIESEVLHDIKRECEKVKSKDQDVMFYLSESDDGMEPSTSRKYRRQLVEAELEKHENFGIKKFSKCSIHAECGKSDVDLSDSDTDSEIQEKIDKILNTTSFGDIPATINDDIGKDNSHTKMKKGRGSLMKMIVSDLRLSESESESELECKIATEEKTLPQERTFKEVVFKAENECINEQAVVNSEIALTEMKDVYGLNVAEKRFASKIVKESGAQSFKYKGENLHPEIQQISKIRIDKSVPSPGEKDSTTLNKNVFSPVYDCFRSQSDKDFIDKEYFCMQDDIENKAEPLDLSVTSQGSVRPSYFGKNEFSKCFSEELKPSTNDDVVEKKHAEEKRLKVLSSISELKDTETNQTSDGQRFFDNTITLPRTSEQEKTEDRDKEDFESRNVILAQSLEKLVENEKGLDEVGNEILLSGHCEEVEAATQKERLKSQVYAANVMSSDNVPYIASDEEKGMKERNVLVDKIHHQSAKMEAGNSESGPKDDFDATISDEVTKQRENISAVKSLEEDIFHDIQPIQNSTEEDMVYYAVELSDDLETNEAVVNLETVELIDGPIIIENNDTHEENILDTNIIQSHVNDQFEMNNEPLNEQIVETLTEGKLTEVKINSALESMTHMENPVFYPTVNDVKSKYLYGINEDSQSSNEVVEELVTDIVNDGTVLEEEVTVENPQEYPEVSPVEIVNNMEKFVNIVSGNAESTSVTCVSSGNTDTQRLQSEERIVCDQTEIDMDSFVSIDNGITNKSSDVEYTSDKDYDKWTERENRSMTLNISENNTDTREMCSQQDRFIQFKADNVSQGYDLKSNETCVNESSEINQKEMDVQSCDIDENRLPLDTGANGFIQEYNDFAMEIEHSDGNDYIITQNENFDDDDDDDDDGEEDNDAMDVV